MRENPMNNQLIHNLWSLTYSFSQGCYHIERLAEGISINREAFLAGRPVDYILLGLGTESEVRQAAARQLELKAERELEDRL
jgi:hypothetical protein